MQLDDEDYDDPKHKVPRDILSARQYLAYLKSNSDAERGKSGYHGVAMRSNDRWQARITGVAVRLCPHPIALFCCRCTSIAKHMLSTPTGHAML